jgi:leucyl aminopeptidase
MNVRPTTDLPADTAADTIAVGVFEDEGIAHDVDGALQALVDSGEARRGLRKVAVAHADGKRWILVGLGRRDEFDPERARVAAAVAAGRARELASRTLCWEVPHHVSDAHAAALVEGTLLAAYEYRTYKTGADDDADRATLDTLLVSAHHDVGDAVHAARIATEAANAARDLQNTPGNDLTPTRLADAAHAIAEGHDALSCEVWGRREIEQAGMGAFAAVARGSDEEPALITLRYEPGDVAGPPLGFVGKAVTFDSGGLSIKQARGMSDMKFDMSGGAVVLQATAAIARLGLPVRIVSVIGATENLPSGRAMKPGDIVRARTGTTIEILNTDAEGRLVLADCLAWAVEQGAERIVDLATLTGAIVSALGSTMAGIMSNDDEWAAQIQAAGERAGELLWRLPLHDEYAELIKGRYADIANAVENRKAGSITAAEFLRRFVGDVPWAHLDIAGVADDYGRPYAAKGGSGFGVRLLVELARANSGAPDLH